MPHISGGFGPVIADGFGIGYIIGKDWAAVFISGFEVSCLLLSKFY